MGRVSEWEVKVTLLHDGRKVGFCDALGDDLDFAMESVNTNIERREGLTLTRYGRTVIEEAESDAN